jgi:hypothetical protein
MALLKRREVMTHTSMEYGHWGITVATRDNERDYAPKTFKTFYYPVSNPCGPQDSRKIEAEAIEYCHSLGGIVKGPFFSHLSQ